MKKLAYLVIVMLAACTHRSAAPVIHIAITPGKTLKFTGLNEAVLNDIARDSDAAVWQIFLPVYKMPADTDMKSYQPLQPGRYAVMGNTIIFTPDTPFVKGQPYFVRYVLAGEGITITDYLKSRVKPGRPRFTDLIFKR